MMRFLLLSTLMMATFLPAGAGTQGQPQSSLRLYPLKDLKVVKIGFGKVTIPCWLMDTRAKQAEGMMYLTASEVPMDKGMLFAFPDAQPRSFYNRNVTFDLDLAYIDAQGVALKTFVLKAKSEKSVPSEKPAKYVLEMRAGAFKKLGIKSGSKFSIPKDAVGK